MKPLFADAHAETAVQTSSPDFNQLLQRAAPSNVQPYVTKTSPGPQKKYTMADIDEVGKATQGKVGDTTLRIIQSVKVSDTGDFGTKLNSLIAETKGLDPKNMGKQGLIHRVLHIGGSLKERMLAEFDTVKGRIDSLVAELDKTADNARQRVEDCEHMYEENFQLWSSLGNDILVLRSVADDIRAQIAAMPAATDGFEAQHKVDLEEMVKRAEKRISDLDTGRTLALQAAPDIRTLQAGMRNLASTMRDIKTTTIPAYTSMFSRHILAGELQAGADLATAVADATNEALKKGATLLTDAAIANEKAMQRGVVDIETLEFNQAEAVRRIEAVAQIARDGEAARKLAAPRLKAIEDHLIARSTPKQLTA